MTWFQKKEFEFKIQTTQHLQYKPNYTRFSFKLPNYIVSYCLNTVAATMTLGSQDPKPTDDRLDELDY
jgi:hypothetical protein